MSGRSEMQGLFGQARIDGARSGSGVLAIRLGARWALFWRRLQTRRALLALTAAQLDDVGLSREQVEREMRRPLWVLWNGEER